MSLGKDARFCLPCAQPSQNSDFLADLKSIPDTNFWSRNSRKLFVLKCPYLWCHKSSRCSFVETLTSWNSTFVPLTSRAYKLPCILPDPNTVPHLSRITHPLCCSSIEYPRLATTLTEKRFFVESGTCRTSTNLTGLYLSPALMLSQIFPFPNAWTSQLSPKTYLLWISEMKMIFHHFLIVWHVLWSAWVNVAC